MSWEGHVARIRNSTSALKDVSADWTVILKTDLKKIGRLWTPFSRLCCKDQWLAFVNTVHEQYLGNY
jgi:hypothetical protein